jgi:hypothetical protein
MATARSREDCGLIGVIGSFAATSKGELLFSGSLYRKFRELRGFRGRLVARKELRTSYHILSILGGAYREAIVSRIAVVAANGSYQAGCRYQGVSEALPPCGRVSIRRHGWIFVQMPSEQVRRTPFRL